MEKEEVELMIEGQTPEQPSLAQTGNNQQQVPPSQMEYGKSGGNTQNILGAVSSLQSAVKESTDPREIAVIRSVISLLSQLIQKDQAGQMSQLENS